MRKENIQRMRLMIVILICISLALGSFWLAQVMDRSNQDVQADQHANEPDYFVYDFSIVRMAKTGQPATIISGARLTHRPLDDSSDIDLPVVRNLTPGRPPMNMHAERAYVDQNNSRVRLTGNVLIERAASPALQAMRLTTPALTVFPDTDRMETDQPVELVLGQSLMSGTGMVANNATRQIAIAHRLRIAYPPAPHSHLN